MSCDNYDLANLLQDSTLPDPDFVHLIGQALRAKQIDSEKAELAYLWLAASAETCALSTRDIT